MIYDLIDLSDWKKKTQILKELKEAGVPMTERGFRKNVETNNKMYEEHITPMFIAHSNNGYIATQDREIIINSLRDNRKRAMTMINGINKTLKAIGENNNFSLEME